MKPNAFPIVGVGASAGGLEALSELLRHLTADTGMGFVVIQHLDPKRESSLAELLSPQAIAEELKRIAGHPYLVAVKETAAPVTEEAPPEKPDFDYMLKILRKATGVDFSSYKRGTLERRTRRRMALRLFDHLTDYIALLREDPVEVRSLYQDLLINVTGFFRDPETFDFLKSKVFPAIFGGRRSDDDLRVWVPGCATSEEVYSIAICLMEYLGDEAVATPVKFFGTDISEEAIARARTGFYLPNISTAVSAERPASAGAIDKPDRAASLPPSVLAVQPEVDRVVVRGP